MSARGWGDQVRLLTVPVAFTAVVLLGVVLLAVAGVGSFFTLFVDPLAYAGLPPHIGFASNLGILVWSAGAAVGLWAVWVARSAWPGRAGGASDTRLRALLRDMSLLTVVLVLDDLYLGHEHVFPVYLGIRGTFLLGAMGLLGLAVLGWHRATILATRWVPLAVGLVALGFSMAVDFVEDAVTIPGHHFWEEGPKLLAIACWSWWLMITARQLLVGDADGDDVARSGEREVEDLGAGQLREGGAG